MLLHKLATDFLISGAARPVSAGASSWAAEVTIKSHGATRKQTMFLHGERHWQWSMLKGWHLSARPKRPRANKRASMADKHIANRESQWVAINSEPDWCEVGDDVIPFDISRTLDHELALYAKTVFARGAPILMLDSIVQGVEGDAGSGVSSSVSEGAGHVWVKEGSPTVFAEGRPVSRHLDRVFMNCKR
ncbi:MAG: DUF4150 domain-containing protein [Delftia acidovorans]|nr:DUF4150 domain-containing protein [Delftia acidovorans]